LVVPADSVLGLQLETSLNSERAQVEDRVDARVTRDVRVGNRVAIPAGTRVIGSVVRVGRGGKVKERAYLSIRFHTVVLADSSRLAINTMRFQRGRIACLEERREDAVWRSEAPSSRHHRRRQGRGHGEIGAAGHDSRWQAGGRRRCWLNPAHRPMLSPSP
jgi:hypothetical protein